MPSMDPKQVREHLEALARANEFEIEELRRTPMELKAKQLWTMMSSADLFESAAEREAEVSEVRERWLLLRRVLSDRERS